MTKVNPAREMERSLKEIGDLLEEELKGVTSYIPKRGMEFKSKKETICNKLREIYSLTEDKQIKELTVEATLMAKKMTKKLLEYKKGVKKEKKGGYSWQREMEEEDEW